MSTWQHHRDRVASLARNRADDDPELIEARRDLKAELLAVHVKKVVESDPPLTEDQRARIAGILRGAA